MKNKIRTRKKKNREETQRKTKNKKWNVELRRTGTEREQNPSLPGDDLCVCRFENTL